MASNIKLSCLVGPFGISGSFDIFFHQPLTMTYDRLPFRIFLLFVLEAFPQYGPIWLLNDLRVASRFETVNFVGFKARGSGHYRVFYIFVFAFFDQREI